MAAVVEVKRRLSSAGVDGVIVGEFSGGQSQSPVGQTDRDVRTQHVLYGTVGSFRLAIGLGMVSCRQLNFRAGKVK